MYKSNDRLKMSTHNNKKIWVCFWGRKFFIFQLHLEDLIMCFFTCALHIIFGWLFCVCVCLYRFFFFSLCYIFMLNKSGENDSKWAMYFRIFNQTSEASHLDCCSWISSFSRFFPPASSSSYFFLFIYAY